MRHIFQLGLLLCFLFAPSAGAKTPVLAPQDAPDGPHQLPSILSSAYPYYQTIRTYSFDTNDMHFHQGRQRFVTAGDFAEYVIDAFDTLWREGGTVPKMLSIGLHLRMIGRPGRIGGLERVLEHMRDKGAVWFARRDAIARHWIARFGTPA